MDFLEHEPGPSEKPFEVSHDGLKEVLPAVVAVFKRPQGPLDVNEHLFDLFLRGGFYGVRLWGLSGKQVMADRENRVREVNGRIILRCRYLDQDVARRYLFVQKPLVFPAEQDGDPVQGRKPQDYRG